LPPSFGSATDDVIQRANSLPYGLAAYVFTNSLQTATTVADALEAGMVAINQFGISLAETPFGGSRTPGWAVRVALRPSMVIW
jgi:succinate-semialdehyde dehydrogenase/glutarate-semialdehyde dehydrogenase